MSEIADAARRALSKEVDKRAQQALQTLIKDDPEAAELLGSMADEVAQQLHELGSNPADGGSEDPPAPPVPDLRYPSVDVWVSDYLLRNYRRSILVNRWCTTWWEHAEAITRLKAMWLSWEESRLSGPAGMATWWRDIGDYHMSVITSGEGPFWQCKGGDHKVPELWESAPPPGMFDEPDPPEPELSA